MTKNAVPKAFLNLPVYFWKPSEKRWREGSGKPQGAAAQAQDECQVGHCDDSDDLHTAPDGSAVTVNDMKSMQMRARGHVITLDSRDGELIAFFALNPREEAPQIEKCVVCNGKSATASAYGRMPVVVCLMASNVSLRRGQKK